MRVGLFVMVVSSGCFGVYVCDLFLVIVVVRLKWKLLICIFCV